MKRLRTNVGCELLRLQPLQFVVDEGQQLLGSAEIAPLACRGRRVMSSMPTPTEPSTRPTQHSDGSTAQSILSSRRSATPGRDWWKLGMVGDSSLNL